MEMTITEITGWYEDRHMEAGDTSHMSGGDVMRHRLSEYEEKVEGGKWPGLPFTCEAQSEDDAISKYNDKFCEYDYYKAESAEFEEDGK